MRVIWRPDDFLWREVYVGLFTVSESAMLRWCCLWSRKK